jgi:excisionase family DNA binding protein
MTDTDLLTISQLARYLGCGRAQAYRLIQPGPGALPAFRIGTKSLRVRREDLLDWIERNRYRPVPAPNAEQPDGVK